jgi:TM2 domain-containing membrane protein YozV
MSTQPVPVQYISAMEQSLLQSLDEEQRVWFLRDMSMYRKDEVVGVLLAIFLGSFGAHHFYLKRTGLGILYLCFFWTGIPALLGFIEAFFMPGRVRRYNDELAVLIAGRVRAGIWSAPAAQPVYAYAAEPLARICPHCGNAILGEARFCAHCGAQSAA